MTNQTTPTLLITASNDRAVPASVSERAAQVMPAATWLDIPDYGHLVHEEAPDLVAAPILAFLARFTASGAA
jgi:magnesium chelatase accessory protein